MKYTKKIRFFGVLITSIIITSLNIYGYESDFGTGPGIEDTRIIPRSKIQVIEMNRDIDIESIVEMAKSYPHTGFDAWNETRYEVVPSFNSPYKAGSLNRDDIQDALNALKMVRYIAGTSYSNVRFTDELNKISQHGAVLMAASGQFDHDTWKPSDMSTDFFSLAYKGTKEANIYAGIRNISYQILGYIADSGSNNIERAGHRRWILNPASENFGIGYARSTLPGDRYGGSRGSMHVFDNPGPVAAEPDTYVAWPNSGDFPIQYFSFSENINVTPIYPWSINLGNDYLAPERSKINLKLTRKRDGKVWNFNSYTYNITNGDNKYKDSSVMHLAVDNGGYGMRKAIIFRPDLDSLGALEDGDIFNIHLSGIQDKDGNDTTLEYNTRFFDLAKEMSRSTVNITVTENGIPVSGATIIVGEEEILTDESGKGSFRADNNSNVNYSVSKDGFGSKFGNVKVGTVTISVSEKLPEYMLGDINGDEEITLGDVSLAYGRYRNLLKFSVSMDKAMDVNEDGQANLADVALLYNYYRGKVNSFR